MSIKINNSRAGPSFPGTFTSLSLSKLSCAGRPINPLTNFPKQRYDAHETVTPYDRAVLWEIPQSKPHVPQFAPAGTHNKIIIRRIPGTCGGQSTATEAQWRYLETKIVALTGPCNLAAAQPYIRLHQQNPPSYLLIIPKQLNQLD